MGPHRRLPHSASKTAFSWRRWFFRGSSTSEHCRRCRKLQRAWQECGWQVRSEGGGILLPTPTLAPPEDKSLAGFLNNTKAQQRALGHPPGRREGLRRSLAPFGRCVLPSLPSSRRPLVFLRYPPNFTTYSLLNLDCWIGVQRFSSSSSGYNYLSRVVCRRLLDNSLGTCGS